MILPKSHRHHPHQYTVDTLFVTGERKMRRSKKILLSSMMIFMILTMYIPLYPYINFHLYSLFTSSSSSTMHVTTTSKYLISVVMPGGGLNNCIIDMNIAAEIALRMNRTLLITSVTPNAHIATNDNSWLHYNWREYLSHHVKTYARVNPILLLTSSIQFHDYFRSNDVNYEYISNKKELFYNRVLPVCTAWYKINPQLVYDCLESLKDEKYIVLQSAFYIKETVFPKYTHFDFSDLVSNTVDAVLQENNIREYIAIHLRLGDFTSYCVGKGAGCLIPDLRQILDALRQEQLRMKIPSVLLVTNQKENPIIQEYVELYDGWFTSADLFEISNKIPLGFRLDKNGDVVFDLALCRKSRVFFGNTFSSFSGIIAILRKHANMTDSRTIRSLLGLPKTPGGYEVVYDQ
jgi:hypothetical protein